MPPANDNFADAIALVGDSGSIDCDNTGATAETPDPLNDDHGSSTTIWYAYTPSVDGVAVFSTAESGASPIGDTILGIYIGDDLASLVEQDFNDDSPFDTYSYAAVPVVGGTTYYVELAGFGGAEGTFALSWDLLPPLVNDDFADAILLTGTSGSVDCDNRGATAETPDPLNDDHASSTTVWWKYIPDSDGSATFTTDAESGDPPMPAGTILGVYVGDDLSSLVEQAFNDDFDSSVTLDVVGGTTLYIEVGGASSYEGTFTLSWEFTPAPPPPPPPPPATGLVVVTNASDDTVSIIDAATWEVVATVAVGHIPLGAVVAHDGSFIVVANQSDDSLSVIETTGYTVAHTVDLGVPAAQQLEISPDDSTVVAVRHDTSVAVVHTATWTVTHTFNIGTYPWRIAYAADGSQVVIVDNVEEVVYVIDTSDWSVSTTVPVGGEPQGISWAPDGSFVVVANTGDNTVTVLDPTDWSTLATVAVGSTPTEITIALDSSRFVVSNSGDQTFSVVSAGDWSVADTPFIGEPIGVVTFTDDGDNVAVLIGFSGDALLLRADTWEIVDTASASGGWLAAQLPTPSPSPPPIPPTWTFELCDQVDVSLADVTGLVTATISPRLNRPFSLVLQAPADQDVWKTIHDDDDPYLVVGTRTIKVRRDGALIANPEIWRVDYTGDENSQRVVITCFDSMVRTASRSVRDDVGNISDWEFDEPIVAGPFIQELFANSITYDDENNADGTPRLFPIDAVNGAFTADCDVTDDYADGPMMLGDLIYRTICDVGLADVMLAPTDTAAGSDPGIYGILHCVTHWGEDLSETVHFDYDTGDYTIKAARRSFDMATVTNRLRYLGPKARRKKWRWTLQATDPGLGTTHYREIQEASRAKYGTLRAWGIKSNNAASEIRELYRSLWKVEDELRVNPRQLLYITPAGNCPFKPFADYNVGDHATVNVSDNLGPAASGTMRIYGFDLTVDVDGIEDPGELIVSPDGAAFPPS